MKKMIRKVTYCVIAGVVLGTIPSLLNAHDCNSQAGCPNIECPAWCTVSQEATVVWKCVTYASTTTHCCECKYKIYACIGTDCGSTGKREYQGNWRNHQGPGICSGDNCVGYDPNDPPVG